MGMAMGNPATVQDAARIDIQSEHRRHEENAHAESALHFPDLTVSKGPFPVR